MAVHGPVRTNGTYDAGVSQHKRVQRTRMLIAIGAVLGAIGLLQVGLINADMSRIEQAGPLRLALAVCVRSLRRSRALHVPLLLSALGASALPGGRTG